MDRRCSHVRSLIVTRARPMHAGSPRLISKSDSLPTLLARATTPGMDLLYHSAICHLASRFIIVVSAWPSTYADVPTLAVRPSLTSLVVGFDMEIQLENSAFCSIAADITSMRDARR